MSHAGQENQGTGLRDIFDIVVKAPPDRLLSLTFQLGETPEDNIIHALCLIVLQKEARALNKLQMLKDNYLAQHLAEKWQMSESKLEDFAILCGHFQEFTAESLTLLARIFKVLSEQRLCEPCLRNLAYKRALSSGNQKTSNCEDLENDHLREEAKVVCGPQVSEWMYSSKDLKSGSYCDPLSSLDEESPTLKVTLSQDQAERAHSLPSPLQATSSMPSYPTHLEISIATTALFQDDIVTPETSDAAKLNIPVLLVSECEAKDALGQSHKSQAQSKSSEPPMFGATKHSKIEETLATKPTTKPNFALPTATNVVLPKMPAPKEMHESIDTDVEEEEIFYAFVIFHAPEDADTAESMREKLEKVISSEGATFSGDFTIPGRSTLMSVEDAINNSAYTVLLLTRNFDTRMQEMETDSALINSIKKKHKDGTVIPLLPRENPMPKEMLPMVLQTINPLEENKSFERKLQRALSPAKIKKQKEIWTAEQKVKLQKKRQETLKNLKQHQKQLMRESARAKLLEEENLMLMAQRLKLVHIVPQAPDGGDDRVRPQNIHIENAQYIMIGNDSQMTVSSGGGADKDDSIYREEEQ
ncbi:TIR domain-containing adapter molecule 1 [Cottoperca gobio]|uniref:TIR domain-containing adapter molecule 1 n=1 Tax=Cottoperca gobio TaxID=56716 RepID=A0A6J2RGU7_COTGO|nr:TIR domain-containing adapter molecule 1-like [Cottoperca gobio]